MDFRTLICQQWTSYRPDADKARSWRDHSPRGTLVVAFAWLTLGVSCAHDDLWVTPSGLTAPPRKPASTISGTQFLDSIKKKSRDEIEAAIYRNAIKGNFPNFLRTFEPVTVSAKSKGGTTIRGTFYVLRDYFSVGKDRDFVRVPMNPITAQRIADGLNLMLPTTEMVDQIYRTAKIKLPPRPMPPGKRMTSVDYFARHHNSVQGQLKKLTGTSRVSSLMAGHKKDVVISNRLQKRRRRVAIYGWHRTNGRPIQPLSLVHDDLYRDYSHGIRLVARKASINGVFYDLKTLLSHPDYHRLFSNEGPMRSPKASSLAERDGQDRASSSLTQLTAPSLATPIVPSRRNSH